MTFNVWQWLATIVIAQIGGACWMGIYNLMAKPDNFNRMMASRQNFRTAILDALIQLRQQNDPTAAAARLQAALEADKERFRK